MRYLAIYKTSAERVAAPPSQDEIAKMGALIERSVKAGTLVDTGGVMHRGRSARVRRSGSKVTVHDGPFTESKEVIAGFAILEARSHDHAIELIKEFLGEAGDGESEIHELCPPAPVS